MNLFRRLSTMKILLIDDDKWIRDSLSLYFEGEGCYLETCETAEEGLERLMLEKADIIIADYRLPGMDGLEFLRRVHELYPKAINILVTAYRGDDVASRAISIGIDDFIEKPLNVRTIEVCLSRLIEKQAHTVTENP
ncbi:MAG: response regulator [Syntrophus sp. (in: bacteria)]|nr:response regulator [Syntrophus sp. (in: bacteria)]